MSHCGWLWLPLQEVLGEALLPGDIVSIARPKGGAGAEEKVVPADCLLLAGAAALIILASSLLVTCSLSLYCLQHSVLFGRAECDEA